MPTNGRIHRFVGISLEYIHGAEKQHAAADVSNIGFIANGLDHTLSLASSSLNHWTAKDSSSLVLSSQAGSLVVVLRDKDLDAIAHIVISHAERAFWDAVPLRPGYKPSRRVQMQNFSDAETGRWLLSWQIETESKDKNSQPTPVQQDNKRRSEPHEEAVYLTNLVAVYTPEDDEQDAAQADISKLVLTAGDQRWSLTLNSSSLNHWEAEVNSLIDISKEATSLNVWLQDSHSEDVAVTFGEKLVRDVTDDSLTGGCAGGADLISMKGSGGSWRVGWRIETLDYERRDDDLVARWKKLEVLYPGDRWVDRRPDNPAYAITAFLVGDANCFGSDIIRKQGHALLAKNKTEYGGSLASIEEAIEIQMFLVVDPRVQQCQQMHAIATSYLGSMYHERFNQTVVAGDLDQALSLYQTAVERSTPQSDIHADCLHRLAEGYRSRYQSASDDDDSGRGITALSEACDSNQKDPGLLLYRVCVLVPWLTEHFERGKSLDPVEKAIPGLFRVLAVIQDDHSNPLFPQVEAFGNFISRFADAVEHKRLEGAFNLGHSSASSGEVPCGDAQISQVVKEMVEDRSSSTLLFASPPPEVSAHIDSNNASLPEKAQIYMDVQAHPSSQIMPGPSVQQVPEASHTPSPELQALQAQRTLDERRIARLEQEVVDLRCLLQKALVAQVVQATTSKKRPRLEEQPDLPPLPSPSLSSLTGLPGFFESALQPATSSKRPRLA